MRALIQILPLVTPGILGTGSPGSWTACAADADYLTHFFVCVINHYYELRRYNRPAGGHSDRTIETVEHTAARVKMLLKQHFQPDQTSGFKIPKMHAGYGRHVGGTIRLLGSPRRFMTEFGEGSVKTGHSAYEGTNKQHSTATEQMATILSFRAASTQHLLARGGSAAPAGLGSRQTAKRLAEGTSCNRLAGKAIATLSLSDFDSFNEGGDVPVLKGRMGMDVFVAQLQQYYEAAEEAVPTRIAIVNSAAVAGKQAHHANNPVNTLVMQTIYATPSFRGQSRFSFVAIDGGEAGEYVAQVQLLFRTPEDQYEHAFVRYLKLDVDRWEGEPDDPQRDPLFGNGCAPLVWERASGPGSWPYEVVLLSTIIRREFIFPDVRDVFAPPPTRRKLKAAAKRKRDFDSDDSDGTEEDGDTEASSDDEEDDDGDDDVAAASQQPADSERFIRASCFIYERDDGERFWETEAVPLE